MTRFIIIRHGFSQGNKEKRFSGQMDVPLDAVGVSQARSIARYILENYKVDCVYASDLCRAYDTVKPIADALDLPVIKEPLLREVDVGRWQGMLIEDVKRLFPESFERYRATPGLARFDGGEGYIDVMERGKRALAKIAAEHDGETVLIGTHGGVIRTMRAAWAGTDLAQIQEIPHVPNASTTVVEYENGNVRPIMIGYDAYLEDKTTEEGIK